MEITLAGMDFRITSRLVESGVNAWGDNMMHNHFKVSVKHEQNSISFDYYGSQHDWQQGNETLEGNDLLFTFRSFLGDAQSGAMTFEDFCGEFGYDTDSRQAEKIWKACKKAMTQAKNLGIDEDKIYELFDALSAKGVE